jgi:hypothetical protein
MRNLVSTPLDVYVFVSARVGNTEPETETPASPSDARRDKPPRSPRRSPSAPAAPRLWPTPRDLRARTPCRKTPYARRKTRTPRPGGQGVHSEPFGAPVSQRLLNHRAAVGRHLKSCRRRAAPQIVPNPHRSDSVIPEPERHASATPWTSPVITPRTHGTARRPRAQRARSCRGSDSRLH